MLLVGNQREVRHWPSGVVLGIKPSHANETHPAFAEGTYYIHYVVLKHCA